MDMLLDDPAQVAAVLAGSEAPIYGVEHVEVCMQDAKGVTIELVMRPWVACAQAGFPTERFRVLATTNRQVFVVPQDDKARKWKHRNRGDLGDLCLWYQDDDPALRWTWNDGLVALITIAHRHVQYEEYWRRTSEWPVEDTPHGDGHHPVRSVAMREAVREWRR